MIAFVLSHIEKSLQWTWYSEELKKRNQPHFFILLTPQEPPLANDLRKNGIEVYHFATGSIFQLFTNLPGIVKIFRLKRPEVVHTSLPYGNLGGLVAAWWMGIKKRITTCENASWAFDFKSRKQWIIDKISFALSKKIIATCEISYEYLINNWKIKSNKLAIITQGLRLEEYEAISPDRIKSIYGQLGLEENSFCVGMIARFEYWKGHQYAIEAIELIKDKYPSIRLLIFGSKGSYYNKIMQMIKDRGLAKHVLYKGFIQDTPALLRTFDIHLHVPINAHVETFGLTVIEGMAAGCAQILTRSGIAHTTAKHGTNCLVVDFCSSDQIASSIETLINDPSKREALGQQARIDAKQFSNERKAEECLALYHSI